MSWKVENYLSEKAFVDKTESAMTKVKPFLSEELPNLVIFPEDLGTPLILAACRVRPGEFKSFASVASGLIRRNIVNVSLLRLQKGIGHVRALYLLKARDIARMYFGAMKHMASRFRVHLIGGSLLLPDFESYDRLEPVGRNVYNVSFIFAPSGEIIHKQRKVHLVDLEGKKGLDVESSDLQEMSIMDLGFARIGLAICYDAFFTDVVGKLASQGAEVLVQPSANPALWTPEEEEKWETGILSKVQDYDQLQYGINPMMVGMMFDIPFEGRSSIVGKRLEGSQGGGYIKRANSWNEEEILVADLIPR